jgi:two-component system sensor histidine kinase AlgZ
LGKTSSTTDTDVYLPDFCAAGAVLIVVLVAELVAIVLTLASHSIPGTFLTELSKMSMFVLWIALLGTGLMCRFRPWLESFERTRAFVIAFIMLLALCLLMAEVTWQTTHAYGVSLIIDDTHLGFVSRTFAISCIVVALTMRYLYVSSEWRRSIVLEAQARVSALQAVIRPHFLFNSMNTIASLTRSDPARAEEAIEDLADLLRANLGSSKNRTTLKQELEVATIYQRIEKLRLGDRLSVRWDVADLPMRALIPSLTIQPLLENAIYHGIELLPDGGEVVVRGTRDGDQLIIRIANPVVSGEKSSKDGNHMAMSNIQQRFELAYGNSGSVEVEATDEQFTVTLTFPCDESSQ